MAEKDPQDMAPEDDTEGQRRVSIANEGEDDAEGQVRHHLSAEGEEDDTEGHGGTRHH